MGEGGDGGAAQREVVLFIDTFNRYFEPENARAAVRVLQAAGYTVHLPRASVGGRPLCCGRTFLASGLVDEARAEARRMIDALAPFVERGVPVVGWSHRVCRSARRVSLDAAGGESAELAMNAFLFEEFLLREHEAGASSFSSRHLPQKKACCTPLHQKAFAVMRRCRKCSR